MEGPPGVARPRQTSPDPGVVKGVGAGAAAEAEGNVPVSARAAGLVGADACGVAVAAAESAAEVGPDAAVEDGSTMDDDAMLYTCSSVDAKARRSAGVIGTVRWGMPVGTGEGSAPVVFLAERQSLSRCPRFLQIEHRTTPEALDEPD